jgi:predicted ATPase/DNA-binding winged helix-turn-helix (wHTH) protein
LTREAEVPESSGNLVYAYQDWEVDLSRRELRSRGIPVLLGSRAFEIVTILVQSAAGFVSNDHLMERVWPGITVGEGTIRVHISAVRKALGPDRNLLKTSAGRGYHLLGSWTPRHPKGAAAPVELSPARVAEGAPQDNFPLLISPLVGRDAAAQFVRDLVSAYRVVTLTGPGGIGKTSLAIKAVRDLISDFGDGGWIIELASLSDPSLVPSAVASTLGLKLGGEISAESVARAVGERHLLLLLDNCEHVIDTVANLAETFTRLCPRATIVATSREVMRIDGEAVYRVPPLEVPATGRIAPDHIVNCSAVELFLARTKALNGGFSPSAEDLASIGLICRRLDGIPLAIEFAAARAAVISVQGVAAGLRDRFALLTVGRRTALPRQQTLRATLDWSHELLPDAEQRLLRRLALFPGGFSVDAAVAVMADTGFDASAVLEGIANLGAKSWVGLDKSGDSPRWSLLETVRAYALAKLVEHGEADITARHHAAYFLHLLAPVSGFRSRLSEQGLNLCIAEIDNVRAALDWSFSPAGDQAIGIGLTAVYAPVWRQMSLMSECRERCERALVSLQSQDNADRQLRMELQMTLASAMFITMGPAEQARTLLTDAIETADALNDHAAQIKALTALLAILSLRGETGRAIIATDRVEQIAEQLGDPISRRIADRQRGTRLLMSGQAREAQQYFERALRSHEERDDRLDNRQGGIYYNPSEHAMARVMLARALCMQGFAERALREAHFSLEDLQDTDYQLQLCQTMYYGICRIATMLGDFTTAEREIARLIELARRSNAQFWETAGHFCQGKLLVERGEFAQGLRVLRDAFETSDRTGWRLSYPEFRGALATALAGLGRTEEALETTAGAEARAHQDGNARLWYHPELLRIRGEILLQRAAGTSASEAEDCFSQAAELARAHGALFWELRIALSLARLRVRQGRSREAGAPLASVYNRFTEGFATADLQAARRLLEELA